MVWYNYFKMTRRIYLFLAVSAFCVFMFSLKANAGVYDPSLTISASTAGQAVINGSRIGSQDRVSFKLTVLPASTSYGEPEVTAWTVVLTGGSLCNVSEGISIYTADLCTIFSSSIMIKGSAVGDGWSTNQVSFLLSVADAAPTSTVTALYSPQNSPQSYKQDLRATATGESPFSFLGNLSRSGKWFALAVLAVVIALFYIILYQKKIRHFVFSMHDSRGLSQAHIMAYDLNKKLIFESNTDDNGYFYAKFVPGKYHIKISKGELVLFKIEGHEEMAKKEDGLYSFEVKNSKENIQFGLTEPEKV